MWPCRTDMWPGNFMLRGPQLFVRQVRYGDGVQSFDVSRLLRRIGCLSVGYAECDVRTDRRCVHRLPKRASMRVGTVPGVTPNLRWRWRFVHSGDGEHLLLEPNLSTFRYAVRARRHWRPVLRQCRLSRGAHL